MGLRASAVALTRGHPELYRLARGAWSRVNNQLPPRQIAGLGPVHRNDLMYAFDAAGATEHYVRIGRQAADFLDGLTPLATADGVLDFGCGHGRVARVLAERCEDGMLAVCDLDPTGVKFCAETFRAFPIVGDLEPARLVLGYYDLIWMGSVFTHIPLDNARALTRRLASRLRPGGHLAFTTHGPQAERDLVALAERGDIDPKGVADDLTRDGWAYRRYPHYTGEYGVAWQRPEGVAALVEGIGVPLRQVTHLPDAWDGAQDIWAFRREPTVSGATAAEPSP